MIKTVCLGIVVALAASSRLAAADSGSQRVEHGELSCAEAVVRQESHCLHFDDHDKQCLSQEITLTNAAHHVTRTLRHDAKRIRQFFLSKKVLDATVTGWACHAGEAGTQYVYLSYTCVENPHSPECAGTHKEWGRLFDTQGNELGSALPRRSPAFFRLMSSKGLGQYLNEGIQLQDVSE